ncbi:AsmA family/AsmA-like C-terminal region [Bacteroidales bacterium 6E]|nr:AsmA family/AsmA-like C-terminal region [Bacteroidales bacterium 6E]
MKKGIIIGGIIFVVVLAILVAIPFVFRDTILEKTRASISKNLNAEVNFGDFQLSLIKNFPKASVHVKDLTITGKGAFAGDTLLWVGSAATSFGLFDIFTPDDLTVNEIILDQARLNLLVNANEEANWDIMPETTVSEPSQGSGESDAFGLQLSHIGIRNSVVTYTDVNLPLQMDLTGIDMVISGEMYGSDTQLRAEGTSSVFNLTYDSIRYISKTALGLKSLLDINFDEWKFVFSEGELLVNQLPVDVSGMFSMPTDTIHFDLDFVSKASTLGEIMALIPPDYEQYTKDLQATGDASLKGYFKGFYFGETYPELKLDLVLNNGNARYAGMPEDIKNITLNLGISKLQGDFNQTVVSISNARFEVRNNLMELNLRLSNLLEDLRFDGQMQGKLNFTHLKDALPIDSLDIQGLVDLDLGMRGNLSAIEARKYDQIQTAGRILLSDFVYNSKDMTLPVIVSSGRMDFAPERIDLAGMDMKIGNSDFAFSGSVADYYPYLFSAGTLRGNVQLKSNLLNLNELMKIQSEKVVTTTLTPPSDGQGTDGPASAAAITAFQVPDHLNLAIQADVKRALYDNLDIKDVTGTLLVNNGRLDLRGVNMHMLDGEMNLAGYYANSADSRPLVDMKVDILNFDIPTAYRSLALIRKYLPIAAQSKGRFSTSLSLNGQLNEQMGLMMPSINGGGLLKSMNVQVVNSPVFNKIKSVLNEEKLRDMRIDDFTAQFSIENGNLVLKPFATKVAGQQAVFAGRLNVENLIEMQIGFQIQRDALSKNIENTLGILPGQQNIQLIPVGIEIKGPVNDPEVKVDLSDAKAMVAKEVKNATKEELQKTINKLGDGLKKLLK